MNTNEKCPACGKFARRFAEFTPYCSAKCYAHDLYESGECNPMPKAECDAGMERMGVTKTKEQPHE